MSDYLIHHGIKGQKWGIRRFENADGTLTAAGKKRYQAQESYANSYKNYKEAKKLRTSDFRIGGLSDRRKRIATARADKDLKKAEYLYSKARSDKSGERARDRYINKSLRNGHLFISTNDMVYGGNYVKKMKGKLETEYGKEYADKQIRRAKGVAIASFATSVAVHAGIIAVGKYMRSDAYKSKMQNKSDWANGIIPDDKKWREIPNPTGLVPYRR